MQVCGGCPIIAADVSSLIVNADIPPARAAPRTWLNAVSICIWIVYLVVPVEGWGLFPGRPLGLLPATALAVACWVAFARGTTSALLRVVAIALVLKIGLGATLLVPHGFAALYYANANFSGPAERGTEPADAAFTRTDHRLSFGIERGPDVPLEFFNDVRFNFYQETDADRNALPFSVSWQGLWRVTSAGPQRLYVRSPGGATQISVGDNFSARVAPGENWTGAVTLAPGFHRVAIAWSVPQGGVRRFEAGRIVDGHEEPFDDAVIVRHRAGALALAADSVVRAGSQVLDALLCAWLAVAVGRQPGSTYRRLRATFSAHDAVSIAWAFGIADALVFAVPVGRPHDHAVGRQRLADLRVPGARHRAARPVDERGRRARTRIALSTTSRSIRTFSPRVIGCSATDCSASISSSVCSRRSRSSLLWRTVALLFDEPAGLAALVTAIVVIFEKYVPWSGVLLTETLFVPLVCIWVYTLVRLACAPIASTRDRRRHRRRPRHADKVVADPRLDRGRSGARDRDRRRVGASARWRFSCRR